MKRILLFFLLQLFTVVTLYGQVLTQNVFGKVYDAETEEPLPFVNIFVKNTEPLIGTTSDEEGNYLLENIPVGRIDIEITFMGYESLLIPEVMLNSSREYHLDVRLIPSSYQLNEVVLQPSLQKQKPINRLATVSARMLSVEESSRYAGGADDPARLATSFAGVSSSNGSNNALVIRGNAPKYLQWKIEGVEVPNPNHFANLVAFGGGGITALSSNLLSNSDFFTGAFPATYNNAISGVFDLHMRNGNAKQREWGLETGLIGIDVASEGTFSYNHDATYVFNYRYSTLGLLSFALPEESRGINYQDLSFKMNFPTQNSGNFTLWSIGLLDKSSYDPKEPSDRKYEHDFYKQDITQFMGSLGVNHKYRLKGGKVIKTSLAYTTDGIDYKTDKLDIGESLNPKDMFLIHNHNVYLNTSLQSRWSDHINNISGLGVRGMFYNMDINEYENDSWQHLVNEEGSSTLYSGYTQFTFNFPRVKIQSGVNMQYFNLNEQYAIEPRLGVTYKINEYQSMSMGYGLHSRLEPLHYYFSNAIEDNVTVSNRDLGFTKAHHWVLGYDVDISDKVHLKIEPYFQKLYNVPMVKDTNESLINEQTEWFVNNRYINKGEGKNYGIDVTLEQYMNQGFYYLISGSLFQSLYKNNNSEWYNTRYNKNFVANVLLGKELNVGKNKQNALSFNIRLTLQGGEMFTRIDKEASVLNQEVVYDYSHPYTEQIDPAFIIHTTIDYKWNKPKTSHKIALKVLNANQYKEFQGHQYNFQTNEIDMVREALMVPNLSYKILF
jgi:hypothetical protein